MEQSKIIDTLETYQCVVTSEDGSAGVCAVDAEGWALDNGTAKVTEVRLASPVSWITGSVTGVD